MILGLKNDGLEFEINIFQNNKSINFKKELKKGERIDLLKKIEEVFEKNKLEVKNVKKVIIFKGPGGFTVLRNSFAIANTICSFYNLPIILGNGKKWFSDNLEKKGKKMITTPDYGMEPNITVATKKFWRP